MDPTVQAIIAGGLMTLVVGPIVLFGLKWLGDKLDSAAVQRAAEAAQRRVEKTETDGRLDVIHAAANSALTAAQTATQAAEKLTQEGVRAAAAKDAAHAKEIAAKDALIEALKHPVKNNGAPTDAKRVTPAMSGITDSAPLTQKEPPK